MEPRQALFMAGAACATLGSAQAALAQDADHWRGGWRTEPGTDPHVYEFVIRGDQVTGVTCTRCSDGTTLAFIDGTFDEEEGITFTVTHVNDDGSTAHQDQLSATLEEGRLAVTGTSGAPGGGEIDLTLVKDPRGPAPQFDPVQVLPPGTPEVPAIVPADGGGAPPAPYVQPGGWRQLTNEDVVGLWLAFGEGMNKQFFFFREVGDELRGMVCGRCDNPYTMAALENVRIEGDTLYFDIVHQDWGEFSPVFDRHIVANIGMNEMRAGVIPLEIDPSNPPTDQPAWYYSAMGPIAIAATRGNDSEGF